ncbi:MAG: hypothetical protein QM754_17680 [Tepidisphaeraceae bacterium]
MIEKLSSRIHFSVFGPDFSYDDGFPAVTDGTTRFHVSGGKTLAAFNVQLPYGGGYDELPEYETHLKRFFADGTLDRTFGLNGTLDLNESVTVQLVPGQRILTQNYDGAVIKALTLNGRVDTGFGGGDGVTEIPVSSTSGGGSHFNNARVVSVLDDGRILTQSSVNVTARGQQTVRHTVAVLKPDGTIDPDFGKNGVVSFSDIGSDLTPLLTDRGLYLFMDRIGATDPPSADIIKLTTNGKTGDPDFGTGGSRVAIPGFVTNFVEQPDGKLLFLDRKYQDGHTLYRLNADGSPDTSFSGDGKIYLEYTGSDSGLPLSDSGISMVVDAQNRIVVSADNTIYRLSPAGVMDAYPFNGTAPFPARMASIDSAGNVITNDGQRDTLVSPQQINAKGIINIVTDNQDDVIKIADAGNGRTRVIVNGESKLFKTSVIRGVSIKTYDGTLDLNVSVNTPVTLVSGDGDAVITLADGDDDIELGTGDHTIALGGGNDAVRVGDTPRFDATSDPNAGDRQMITATAGNKNIDFLNGSATITLPAGDHEVSGYREVHDSVITIAGGNNIVRLSGTGGDTVTIGGRGKNNVTVFGENTRVATGAGPDEILAISPYGLIDTGRGDDVVTVRNFTESPTRGVTVNGGEGDDHIFCDANYNSLATVYGGNGNDLLEGNTLGQRFYGGGGDDTLFGDLGDDTLYGGDGNDLIRGGAGQDRLFGDDGFDRLYGDAGRDALTGGADTDRFYARDNTRDLIYGEPADRVDADDIDERIGFAE